MADSINLSGGGIGGPRGARTLYQSEGVREVQSRARYLEHEQTPQEQAGVKRLNRLLAHDGPPEQPVPRGYFINIQV